MPVLGDICTLIVDSEHKTAPKSEVGHPMIRTPDIGLGRLNLDRAQKVDEETYQQWTRRAVPEAGDLILAREAPVGNVGIVLPGMEPCLGQRTVLLRPDRSKVDPHYLDFLLSGPELRGRMDALSNGATVPHLNMKDIRALTLPDLPSRDVQVRIASTLSAYDELIENNTRRIQILEEMAQAIYREWFDEFRYPGHEGVPLVDSDLGPIPEDWQVRELSDLVSTQYGYTESTAEEPVGPRFLRGMDMNKTSYIDWARVPYCPISDADLEKFRLRRDDVLIIRMADPGKVGIVEEDVEAVFASYLVRLRPLAEAPVCPYFLFFYLSAMHTRGTSPGRAREPRVRVSVRK